jgi:iron(III) transport system substrate-binding protein
MMRAASLAGVSGVLVAVVLVATACGGGGGDGKSIVLYNGQHLGLTRAMVSAFEKQTGISVRTRSNDSVVLADLIAQEGGSSPADVYLTENSPELMHLEEQGLLAKLSPSVVKQVPARYSSPTGKWAGVALRVSSLVYNPSLVSRSKLPHSILDLARPEWNGKVAISPFDSDFPPVVGAVIATHGKEAASAWMAGLKRNAEVYQDAEAVVAAVNRGDVAAGVVNTYYWYRLRLELGAKGMHSSVHYFPSSDVGSVVNIAGAAVLASAHNPEGAERFVEFLLSPSGQRIIPRGDDFEYPARPGIAPNSALPPLERVPHASLSVVQLGDDEEAAELVAGAGFGS